MARLRQKLADYRSRYTGPRNWGTDIDAEEQETLKYKIDSVARLVRQLEQQVSVDKASLQRHKQEYEKLNAELELLERRESLDESFRKRSKQLGQGDHR